MVRCLIVRDRGVAARLLPTYKFFFQEDDRLAMKARKQARNKTSNYHIFDMSRGVLGRQLSKKNGNYIGKMRSNFFNTENTLYTESEDREELAHISFERPGIVEQIRDGSQPRKLFVMLPPLDRNNCAVPHRTSREGDSLADIAHHGVGAGRMVELQSKEPAFEDGNYRLNFRGRVTMPSVKNFQLVSLADVDDVVCQFGKVGEDAFHLDYKAPLCALTAFSVALSQFNY